jgi:hypothetical protein
MYTVPLYLIDMRCFESSQPEVHREFLTGNFTVHHTEGQFTGVWTDLEGRTTLLQGLRQEPKAREKYIKPVLFKCAVSESVKLMANVDTYWTTKHHGDTRKDREKKTVILSK